MTNNYKPKQGWVLLSNIYPQKLEGPCIEIIDKKAFVSENEMAVKWAKKADVMERRYRHAVMFLRENRDVKGAKEMLMDLGEL